MNESNQTEPNDEFKTMLNQLKQLQKDQQQLNQKIYDLTESIYSKYKCKYLRICYHCGQDGSDTIWECDCYQREIQNINDCNILKCIGCEVINKKK